MTKSFTDFLKRNSYETRLNLFLDIETLQYNEARGRVKPSEYKNVTYSVAVSYYDRLELKQIIFPNFKEMFDAINNALSHWKQRPTIDLIIHNGNKYDNHFIRYDLIYYYDLAIEDLFLRNAEEVGNVNTLRLKDIKDNKQDNVILEKRVKSSNNLELIIFLNGTRFNTVDNWVKTNMSLQALGQKLLNLDLLKEEELKTDFNYTEYNRDDDMTAQQAKRYAKEVFDNLDADELTYIRNDVIILAKSYFHYSELFKGFDYSRMTFTSNILAFYNQENKTSFQLLGKVSLGDEAKTTHIKYTDYTFSGMNFYDWLKPFYRGGLNFYNQDVIGEIITEPLFAIDINSSYPYVMHNEKIPMYLKDFQDFEDEKEIPMITNDDSFFMYQVKKKTFDLDILNKISSKMLVQILVKYYSTDSEYMNINSYTIRMIRELTGLELKTLKVKSFITYETEYFNGRELISEKYKTKTQGANNKKIDYVDPYDIKFTDEEVERLPQEEIENSKVLLNGLYGIPALRPYYNLFRNRYGELVNIPNGFKNSERNIVFSIFVTAVSIYNLLKPLTYLTQNEIDENFIYADTDSLYLKKAIEHKLPKNLFDDLALGKWDYDEHNIRKFSVINHKKYTFERLDKNGKPEIVIRSAGIPRESFDLNMPFEEFVKTQFSSGSTIKNTKSIFNQQGTISIYESSTKLKAGGGYPLTADSRIVRQMKEIMFEQITEQTQGNDGNDLLFIESPIGTFSLSDLYPVENETIGKNSLHYLALDHQLIKEHFESML